MRRKRALRQKVLINKQLSPDVLTSGLFFIMYRVILRVAVFRDAALYLAVIGDKQVHAGAVALNAELLTVAL